jgi:hypothetical protein
MKRTLLLILFAVVLGSCKKDKSDVEPKAFSLFTREPVALTLPNYMLKGTIASESSIDVIECGFIYIDNLDVVNGPSPDYYTSNTGASSSTVRIPIYTNSKVPPGNFETKAVFTSKRYIIVNTYVKIHNQKSNMDEVILGTQRQTFTQ